MVQKLNNIKRFTLKIIIFSPVPFYAIPHLVLVTRCINFLLILPIFLFVTTHILLSPILYQVAFYIHWVPLFFRLIVYSEELIMNIWRLSSLFTVI